MIDKSDLILLMLNNNEQLTDDIKEIFEKIKDKNYIVIINKIVYVYRIENLFSLSYFYNRTTCDYPLKYVHYVIIFNCILSYFV